MDFQDEYPEDDGVIEAQSDIVPAQYACPICGKWGRRKEVQVPHPKYSWKQSIAVYYCTPKARRGGKGCGEMFKHLKPACESHLWVNNVIEFGIGDVDRISMGYQMIKMLKDRGQHNPYARSCNNSEIHGMFERDGDFCACGCGKKVEGSRRFHNSRCADLIYGTAQMIAHQGRDLYKFMAKTFGEKCNKCDETKRLEIDHIIEVKNGGGMCWIDNFQFLCKSCHARKTAEFAAARAKSNREIKAVNNPQMSLF